MSVGLKTGVMCDTESTNLSVRVQVSLKKLLDLMDDTGCELIQVNGQRVFGPTKDWTGPLPAKGCEVFVGKIPRELYEDELVPLFQSAGRIYQLRLMMDFSGTNRGYAFVQYCKPNDAKLAIKKLNGFEVRPGWKLYVSRSVDNCRLFVGGIPRNITQKQLEELLPEMFENIVDIKLYMSPLDKTENRGFAFVEFANHRSAAMARRKCYPSKFRIWGQKVSIDWACPEREVEEEVLVKVKILYLRNLTLEIEEEDIKQAFLMDFSANEIQKVKKIKDFAFVHFRTREAAERALHHWNNKQLGGSLIEVTWAKPKDKLLPRPQLKRYERALSRDMSKSVNYNPEPGREAENYDTASGRRSMIQEQYCQYSAGQGQSNFNQFPCVYGNSGDMLGSTPAYYGGFQQTLPEGMMGFYSNVYDRHTVPYSGAAGPSQFSAHHMLSSKVPNNVMTYNSNFDSVYNCLQPFGMMLTEGMFTGDGQNVTEAFPQHAGNKYEYN